MGSKFRRDKVEIYEGARGRRLLRSWLALLVMIGSVTSCDQRADSDKFQRLSDRLPNILFILTDDQRFDAVGYSGNAVLKTPNLDRLASQGMRLDRFYVANPVCFASRANFLTGRYHHEDTLARESWGWSLRTGISTVADRLGAAGYVTGFIGKSHLGARPQAWGFDRIPVMIPDDRLRPTVDHISPELIVDGIKRSVPGHITQILTDAAIDYVDSHRDEPWFLWLATTAPHVPYRKFKEYEYQKSEIAESPPPGWPRTQELVSGKGVFDWPAYYSTISMLDHQIGRLLKQLDALGLTENTIVIFTSDNGIQLGSHGYATKAIWFDESTRVPAVVRWPGMIRPGSVSRNLASAVDFLPTVLDIAGLPPVAGLAGTSLLPLLQRDEAVRTFAYSESWRPAKYGGGEWRMIVKGRWKYVNFLNQKEQHLYDMDRDPGELDDLIRSKAHEEVVAELANMLGQI